PQLRWVERRATPTGPADHGDRQRSPDPDLPRYPRLLRLGADGTDLGSAGGDTAHQHGRGAADRTGQRCPDDAGLCGPGGPGRDGPSSRRIRGRALTEMWIILAVLVTLLLTG